MKMKSNKRIKRTDEELLTEALKYTNRLDFQNKSNPHYKQAWRKGMGFLNKICSHMEVLWEPKWHALEEVQKESLKYNTRTSFARGSSGAYSKAQSMGWLDRVCSHMGEKCNESYSLNDLKEIASKCKNKQEFREKYLGAYCASIKLKILNEICSHMDALWEIKWDSFEKIHKEALKYSHRRSEFKKGSNGAWCAARRMGILDEVCSHMKMPKSTSIPEQEILTIVKEIFPNSKKIKDHGVKIKGRPFIKRFEIDIFVPELNKGIEFDGTYHHSFEFMRKSSRRKLWSDKDIKNYHKIKDSWFASKGIEILHIKEEDWNKDKNSCIEKCLEFLGVFDVKKIA